MAIDWIDGVYLPSRWGQVHGLRAGAAGPRLVLLHEAPLSSRVWCAVIERLARHARVLALDIPGYGSSSPPPGEGTHLTEYADVLAEAVRRDSMDAFVVAGVHTGASLAIEVAHRSPGSATGVVVSGPLIMERSTRQRYRDSWAPPLAAAPDGAQFAAVVDRYREIWPDATAEMLELAVLELLRTRARYHWGYHAAFEHDPSSTVAGLAIPLLALTAERDRLADGDIAAVALARDGRQVVHPGLLGQPHLRAPDWYCRELLAFAGG